MMSNFGGRFSARKEDCIIYKYGRLLSLEKEN